MTGRDREWLERQFADLRKEIVKLQIDVAALKVRAGVWGIIGGAIPVAIGLGIYLVEKI